MKSMKANSWKPCAELAPYIERYWSWESGPDRSLPILLPGTGNDLFVHFQQPFSPINHPAHVLCVRSRPWPLKSDGPTAFIAIRFRMGALRHFCRLGLGELFDQSVTVEQLWGREGQQWAENVALKSRSTFCRAVIEESLLRWLRRCRRPDGVIDGVAARLYYDHANCRVEDLASNFHMGRRHLERRFKAAMGVSPKAFHRLARFQHVVRDLFLTPSNDGLDTALAHGYYDQSHFIREFESFAQVTPSSLLNHRNFMSHFYNPPQGLSAIPASTFMKNATYTTNSGEET